MNRSDPGQAAPAIVAVTRPEYTAVIIKCGAGFGIRWGDNLINEWAEDYDDLAVAIMRLAVIERCVAAGLGLAAEEASFAKTADMFLSQQSSSEPEVT